MAASSVADLQPLANVTNRLQALLDLAIACPMLTKICLDVSFADIPPLHAFPNIGHALKDLRFCFFELRDMGHSRLIADLLYSLFPAVQPSNYLVTMQDGSVIDHFLKHLRMLQENRSTALW